MCHATKGTAAFWTTLPDYPASSMSAGFQQLWGRQIVHCAFCHGTEFAQKPGALLGAMALLKSLGFLALTPTVTLLLNGETLPPFLSTAHQAFTAAGHKTIESRISHLEEKDGAVLVHFADGHPPEEVSAVFRVFLDPVAQKWPYPCCPVTSSSSPQAGPLSLHRC